MSARHLYIHVPFCARRCAYCDFSIAVRREVPVRDYLEALERELALRTPAGGWTLDTLYFGGGTPSRLGGDGIARALDLVANYARLAAGAELTIEVNPEDVTDAAAKLWVASGVNRFSLGVQSFSDRALKWMHRVHSAAAVPAAIDRLRAAGANNISLDLIFALPASVDRNWTFDLKAAIDLGVQHVSLYGLTVETGTPLKRWIDRGIATEPGDERYELDYLEAHRTLTAAGFEHYEVSNFGKPGFHSRHNRSYWSGVTYAAVGPSAHAFDGCGREWNVSGYAEWVRSLASGKSPTAGREELSGESRELERIYLGLRTDTGLALDILPDPTTAHAWRAAGWAEILDGRIRLTAHGWLRLDALVSSLTVAASRC
jgi:oxygen-independent coproporphyrinogen-3 oxidase